MKRLACLLALTAPFPASAQAPATTAPKPLDPAAEAAARELVEASNVRAVMLDSKIKMVEQMRSGAALSASIDQNPQVRMKRASNPQAWDAALRRLGAKQAAIMDRLFTDMLPEIETMTIRLYAENFSVADLKAMTAFYRTPLGHRMIEKLPLVMGQTMGWVQTEIPKRIGPAMAELQPEVQRELGALMSTPK